MYLSLELKSFLLLCAGDEGVDEVELMLDPHVAVDRKIVADKARVVLQRGGPVNKSLVSIVPRDSQLLNDYDPQVIVSSHPSMFPYNKGGPPKGMSLACWAEGLLQRYPLDQFARNIGAIPDIFNRIQRQEVNTQAYVQFKMQPHKMCEVTTLNDTQVATVLDAYASCAFGERLNTMMQGLPPACWTLLNSIKAMGGRVIGTPQSFAALRSKVLAPQGIFGPYTCSINLSPSEAGFEWTFHLAGHDYQINDLTGDPEERPNTAQCYRIIAENPVACAEFLHSYMRAFCAVMLGWPMESDHQVDHNCLFGRICVAYLKYESSTRGGKHAHGQILQPSLQAKRLQQLMADNSTDRVVERQLHGFMESVMTAFFPVPTRPLQDPPADLSEVWKPHINGNNGEQCSNGLFVMYD